MDTEAPIVSARELGRTFRVAQHRPGLWGGLVGLLAPKRRTVEAVRSVSFDIAPGEFVGVVGPNGAGKSTTLKMLTGILLPTAGTITVCGLQPHRQRTALASRLGVVFGQRTLLWWDLSPREGYGLLRAMYRVERTTWAQRLAVLTDRLQLADFLDTPVRRLSLGQKMRCELAAALLHAPPLLLLDEPTIGLDLVAKDALHAFLRELHRDQGTTVLLTSHDLDDIEQLCHRVLVIDGGRVLFDGSLDALRRHSGHQRTLALTFRAAVPALNLPEGARIAATEGRRVEIAFDEAQIGAPQLVETVLTHLRGEQRSDDAALLDLAIEEPRIEEVIRRLYA